MWVGSYIGSRLQVTWLNNWVSVPGRVGYFHLSKASKWYPIQLVLGAHYSFGKGIIYMFLCMCVRYVVFFLFSEGIQEFKESGPFQQWSNVNWQLSREGLPYDSQPEIFGWVRTYFVTVVQLLPYLCDRFWKVWCKLNFCTNQKGVFGQLYLCICTVNCMYIHLLYILHTQLYIYICVCVCVCARACACVRVYIYIYIKGSIENGTLMHESQWLYISSYSIHNTKWFTAC